jgi:hypothetical protein
MYNVDVACEIADRNKGALAGIYDGDGGVKGDQTAGLVVTHVPACQR